MCDMDSYIQIILGGLYAITIISITIYSIVGNIIQQKTMGISPISLNRYNIAFIFSPLYILTFYVGLIIFKPDVYNNVSYVFWLSVALILLISVQAYCILEPYYNLEGFKQAIIKKHIKKIKKKNKKSTNHILEKNIIKEIKKLNEYEGEQSYFTLEDVKDIWNKYLAIIIDRHFNVSNEFKKQLVQIGFNIFDNNVISILESETLVKEELVEIILFDKLKIYNKDLFIFVFNKLFDLYEYYKKNNQGFDKFNQLFINFLNQIFFDSKYINLLLALLFDRKWNIKDAEYISLYLKNIINMDKNINYKKIITDKDLNEKVNYILMTFNDVSEFKCKYGESFDVFIRSCYILIRKEVCDD